MRSKRWGVLGIALALVFASCGDDGESEGETSETDESAGSEETPPVAVADDGPLLEEAGALAADDTSDARGRYDRYFVDVGANDRIVVNVNSTAFDPILEVTPPSSGALVNDDWQGDVTHSRIELISSAAGQMKIEVRAYRGEGEGAYQLQVRRVAADDDEAMGVPVLHVGQSVDGDLDAQDHALSGGDRFDSYVVRTEEAARIAVTPRGAHAPRSSLVGPDGVAMEARDGSYDAPSPGTYRLQVIGAAGLTYRVRVSEREVESAPLLARAHHQFNQLLSQLAGTSLGTPPDQPPPSGSPTTSAPPAPGASAPAPVPPPRPRMLPVRVGDRLNGNLAANDAQLPSGEYFDVYELEIAAAGDPVTVEMESSAFDSFLRVDGPGGGHWENDDSGGTLNSRVEIPLERAGTYRIVTTSYRAGETGPYELKVLARRDGVAAAAPAGGAPTEQRIEGELADGDERFPSGVYGDEHTFEWPAGTRVHIEAQSTEFDTYLTVFPPNGPQRDNDDLVPGQNLNAGMDLQVGESGSWRVLVSSYQPGEVGHYTLVVGGGSGTSVTAPAPGTPPSAAAPAAGAAPRSERGTLAQGDRTLGSGEFFDTFPMTFEPRGAVTIRLESTAFDPYLMVRSPSGHQEDNDDLASGSLNSGLDIAVAEPGIYQVMVTSYRPGETGAYTLNVSQGRSVVGPAPAPATPGGPAAGGPAAAPSGAVGRVWGLFAGITDYPGGTNDLPECANDARKLAEAVRNQGNMPSDQEFLFTDAQATTVNIRQAMQTIGSRIGPDDVFVFFYSGHGGQTDSSTDSRELDERDEYLFVYDGQLMDDEIGQLFDAIHARVSMVAIDACFAGGFAKDVITRRGRVGLFSSEEDVTSAVAGRFQAGGYLSHFLRLGIGGEADADPHNEILTVGELTHYTWRQFGQHASDVRMSMGYQHLVVDRGAVPTSEVLWAVRR